MSLPLPIHAAYQPEENCVVLKFGEIEKVHELDGRYRVAGAVCWPSTTGFKEECGTAGYIIAAAESLRSGIVYLFKESDFLVVNPILRDSDGGIEHPGLSQFLADAWAKLLCNKYYWTGDEKTNRTYLLQILRSPNIEPKPSFVHMPAIPFEQARHSLNTLIYTARIRMDKDCQLARALETDEVRVGPVEACVVAAVTLAAAFQRFPYRKPQ